MSRKFFFTLKPGKNNGTLCENLCTFMMISRRILLRMKTVSDKVVEKFETHTLSSIIFFTENRSIYEKMWKNMVEPDIPQMTT